MIIMLNSDICNYVSRCLYIKKALKNYRICWFFLICHINYLVWHIFFHIKPVNTKLHLSNFSLRSVALYLLYKMGSEIFRSAPIFIHKKFCIINTSIASWEGSMFHLGKIFLWCWPFTPSWHNWRFTMLKKKILRTGKTNTCPRNLAEWEKLAPSNFFTYFYYY